MLTGEVSNITFETGAWIVLQEALIKNWRCSGNVPHRGQFYCAQTQNSCLDGNDWTAATRPVLWVQGPYTHTLKHALLLSDPGLTVALSSPWSPPKTAGQLSACTDSGDTDTHTNVNALSVWQRHVRSHTPNGPCLNTEEKLPFKAAVCFQSCLFNLYCKRWYAVSLSLIF